jgi:hypothetical protein
MNGKDVWIEIINQAFPTLPILLDKDQWLNGKNELPYAYLEVESVSESFHSATANKLVEDVGIIFHFEPPTAFDLSPLFAFLRKERFAVVSSDRQIMLIIDNPKIREKKNRIEFVCRYNYLVSIPKDTVPKIQEFIVNME